jgi:hypothetical protein
LPALEWPEKPNFNQLILLSRLEDQPTAGDDEMRVAWRVPRQDSVRAGSILGRIFSNDRAVRSGRSTPREQAPSGGATAGVCARNKIPEPLLAAILDVF